MAFIMSVINIFGGLTGITLNKNQVDLDKFTLVWEDNFDGESLDYEKWTPLYGINDRAAMRKGGYNHKDMLEVRDGNLHIYAKYVEDGLGGGPAGYYTNIITTKETYEQTYGYFEVRCILPKGAGLWSAFWMNSHTMANVDGTGIDGAEIDIFESPYYHKKGIRHNCVGSNIHFDGYGEDLTSGKVGVFLANNPYEEYNTYGLEWNEEEYIFYINGKETARTSFGGASQSPEYMILSVEFGGSNGTPDPDSWAGDVTENDVTDSDFVVDYVRAYQYR